jgi:hypothetical protein
MLRRAAALAALILLALAPYLCLLRAPLLDADSVVWVESARPAASTLPEIARKAFQHFFAQHFVFYRPVTAVSYVIGSEPDQVWLVHLIEIGLLGGILCWIYRICRDVFQLAPGVASLLTFAAGSHPVAQHIVPFSADRQDLLLTFFLLGYTHHALGGRSTWRRLLLLALALGSKEPAVLLPWAFACFRLAAARGSLGTRLVALLRTAGPDVLVVAAFLAYRTWLLDGFGGYQRNLDPQTALFPLRYFAGMVAPHCFSHALPQWAGITIASLAIFLLVCLSVWRPSAPQAFLWAFLLPEMALYTMDGALFVRHLLPGSLLLLVLLAERLSTQPRAGWLLALTLALPWSALYWASLPWQRTCDFADRAGQHVAALRREIPQHPKAQRIFALDLPEKVWAHPLEVTNFSRGSFGGVPYRQYISSVALAKGLYREPALAGHRAEILPLQRVTFTDYGLEHSFQQIGAALSPLRLRFEGPGVLLEPFRQLPHSYASGALHLDLGKVGRAGKDYLFIDRLKGGTLLPLPVQVILEGVPPPQHKSSP